MILIVEVKCRSQAEETASQTATAYLASDLSQAGQGEVPSIGRT